MSTLSEQAAEEFVAARAFSPGLPGFVGIAVDLPVDASPVPAGRRPLRHGFLDARSPQVLAVSGPPSPGIETALRRMSDDLAASLKIAERLRLTITSPPTVDAHPLTALGTAAAGVRVGLEAGLDESGPLGLPRRWALAHTLAPVLAAAFANSPVRHGPLTGWRSARQARHRDQHVRPAAGEPRAAWARYVMDTANSAGLTPRQAIRRAEPVTIAGLERHMAALRPPVAARGHLEIDAADQQSGDGWRIPATVASVLLDDPRAAEEAAAATAHLADEPALWQRAARDALTDPALAAAARDCFLAAYAALSRQGVSRELRDAIADFTERYVCRSRCPADDILDRVASRP